MSAEQEKTQRPFATARGVIFGIALIMTGLATTCWLSYLGDRTQLASIARRVAGEGEQGERALRLMHWVYNNQGFAKNQRAFLWSKLGPTPLQVSETGGDCADKSRLLSALLREISIPSTMAMCFDAHGNATHTVVDAQIGPNKKMLLDPIWDLHFPKAERGEYYSLIDLRRDPQLLWRRLDAVTHDAPPGAKILRYNRAGDVYDRATTINWDKTALLRSLRDNIRASRGDEVYAIPRPLILEEPKLLVALALAFAALLMMAAYALATAVAGYAMKATEKRFAVALRREAR